VNIVRVRLGPSTITLNIWQSSSRVDEACTLCPRVSPCRAYPPPRKVLQSFSSAVHPCRRLTGTEVALFSRAEDGRVALPGSAKLSRSYPGVDSKGTYRNGERLYFDAPSARLKCTDNLRDSSIQVIVGQWSSACVVKKTCPCKIVTRELSSETRWGDPQRSPDQERNESPLNAILSWNRWTPSLTRCQQKWCSIGNYRTA